MSSVTPPSLPPAPPETPSRRKPGGHPVLTSVAIAAVVLSSFVFLSLRSKTLKALNDLCPTWTTDSGTPGDWAFLVPSVAVVAATVAVGGLLAAVSAMKWKRGALAASLAALVAAPLLFVCAVLSLHMAFFARIGEAVAAHSEPATPDPATNAPAASVPHAESALHRGHDPRPRLAAEDNEVAGQRVEDLVQLPEALAQIDRRRRVLGFRLCATQSPNAEETHAENAESAEDESHAESAETAEPRPGEAGSLLEGAVERSEAGGVSHAEGAEGAE